MCDFTTFFHEEERIGVSGCEVDVVADTDDGDAALAGELFHEFVDCQLVAYVELACWFVQKQDTGRFTFTFMGCGEFVRQQAVAWNIPQGNTTVWDYNPLIYREQSICNTIATKSFLDARTMGQNACSGFYKQPSIDIAHVTGIEDFEEA